MGQRHSTPFTEEELQDYQDLTYFTRKEILYVFEKFKSLDPEIIRQNKHARLPIETVMKLSELNVNPFKDRLCKVFSSENDDKMSFEDFLDMMSVLSNRACKSIKTEYAFRIYDFDGDDMINKQDLRELIRRLISKEERVMQDDDMQELINHILAECDMDEDNCLSFTEFEHVISKSGDFMKIRL
ncbi:calcium and integrin-binding family member 4-like isoform X2 [Centruroides vittatus]|uniref:calcium and integrin-binding family member 4-like isoform X2 n=1 Tax=Centruroides vittatus TaxID=120091 RepID=UPI003510207D